MKRPKAFGIKGKNNVETFPILLFHVPYMKNSTERKMYKSKFVMFTCALAGVMIALQLFLIVWLELI